MFLSLTTLGRTADSGPPIIVDTPPPPVISILRLSDRMDWSSYLPPSDFAGYAVRYTTVAGQRWNSATALFPGLISQSFALFTAFPASALECLVRPYDLVGQPGLPEARQSMPGGPPPPPPPPGPPPPAGAFWKKPNFGVKVPYGGGPVTTPAAFTAALANVNPATQYVLTNGTISGNFTISRSGTLANPLVIAATIPSDPLNFVGRGGVNGTVTVTGNYVWLYGLALSNAGTDNWCLIATGKNGFVTMCQVDAPCGIYTDASQGPSTDWNVGFNRFTGAWTTSTPGHENEHIKFQLRNQPAQPDGWHIYWNFFTHDTHVGQATSDTVHCIYTGAGIPKDNPKPNDVWNIVPYDINLHRMVIEYNCARTERAGCYLKHCCTAQFNDFLCEGTAQHGISFRGQNAINGIIRFNRISGFGQLGLQGWNHQCIGNILTGGTDIEAFTHCDGGPSLPKTLLGANGALIAGNNGILSLGVARSDAAFAPVSQDPLKNVRIEKHTGTIRDDNNAAVTFDASGHISNSPPYIDLSSVTKSATTSVDLTPVVPSLDGNMTGPRDSTGKGATWS